MLLSNSRLRSLFHLDAVVTVASGLAMIAAPALLSNLLQLGSMPEMAIRLVGAEWLLFGLWLVYIWNADYSKPMALFNTVLLALNADLLLLVALFAGYGLGILGWVTMLGTTAFIGFNALQWWLLSRKLGAESVAAPSIRNA